MESQLGPLNTDVRLAPTEPEHAEAMCRWFSDREIAEAVGVQRQASLEETERWLARALEDDSCRPFAILSDGRHVGNVVLDKIDERLSTARLSIYIGEPDARGIGVGDAAVRLALSHAFGQLGLRKVWVTVHVHNRPAIATYRRCGFAVEEVLEGEYVVGGQRVDALRMALDAPRS